MGKRLTDLTGMTFGNWSVGEYVGENKYKCTCANCGYSRDIAGYFLKNEKYPKCVCMNGGRSSKGRIDLTGKVFGEWTVLEYAGDKKWLCQCSCGRQQIIAGSDLRNGKTTKCRYTHTNGAESKFRSLHDFQELTSGAANLYGKTFGEWEIQYYVGNQLWRCKCSCGNIKDINANSLQSGNSTSCGHATTGLKDLSGKTFGFWQVLEKGQPNERGVMTWKCLCTKCNKTIKILDSYVLTHGISKSCGCATEEIRKQTVQEKYGVDYIAQLGTQRTAEQIAAIKSKENLEHFVKKHFGDNKQSLIILADALGIARGTLRDHLDKFNAWDLVEVHTQEISGYEKYLRAAYPTEYVNDRQVLNGKEIDLLYPDIKFGIEFNGNYWHSDLKKADAEYHQQKTLLAFRKGVHLFSIFEYEWSDRRKRTIILDMLSSIIYGDRVKKIYARDCDIDYTTKEEAANFLNKNHLQGECSGSIHIALRHENEIVALMVFGKPRFNSECQYEIIRLAFKKSTKVIGGSEKLFRAFCKIYDPESIISYCDISKFTGRVYDKLGFKLSGITKPNYIWINLKTMEILSRYQTMKSKLIEKGLGTESETEDAIMHRLGYNKIYDCGNFRFIWNKD